MQRKIVHMFFCIALCNAVEALAEKVDDSNLLGLLQHSQQKSKTDSSNLLNLLQHSKAKIAKKNIADPKVKKTAATALLQEIEAEENNPDYLAAVKILSDKDLKEAYQLNMSEIQLFLLDYTTQILQKYSVQTKKETKAISLTDLLTKIAPDSTSDHQTKLSSLTSLLEKESFEKTSSATKKAKINLTELLHKNAVSVVSTSKKTVSLQDLLEKNTQKPINHQKTKIISSKSTERADNLMNLLKTGS